MTNTKVLIAGDWHGDLHWAIIVVDIARWHKISTIIHCGDWGLWPGDSGINYRTLLSSYLFQHDINLYWLPGNHEDFNQIDNFPNKYTKTLEGFYEINPNIFYTGKVNSWQWAGKKLAVVGGAVSIDRSLRKINESWWPQEQLTNEEVEQAKTIDSVDYLFTHDCPSSHPFKSLVPDLDSEIHRWKMTEIGRQLNPKLWFHGHMHMAAQYPFDSTTVYALDCNRSPINDHLKILTIETGEVNGIQRELGGTPF